MKQKQVFKVGHSLYKAVFDVQCKQNVCTLAVTMVTCNQHRNKTDYFGKDFLRFMTHSSGRNIFNVSHIGTRDKLHSIEHSGIYCLQKRKAGHSHWHNIQQNKAMQDKQKSDEANKAAIAIKAAIKAGKSADPNLNSALAKAIELARSKNVPNETIQRVIKKSVESSDEGKEEIVEAQGAGGIMIIVQAYTDKGHAARSMIQSKLKKIGANVGSAGIASHSFERIGIVEIELEEKDSRDHDKHIEMALDAEAEDVFMEEGKDILQFKCSHLQVSRVKNHFEAIGKKVVYAESLFKPTSTVPVSSENLGKLEKCIDAIKELEFVEEVYTNVVPDR